MPNNNVATRFSDEYWMSQALALADSAGKAGEVPVGAIVVRDDICIGRGANRPIATSDPSAHAEIVALRAAAENVQNYRLPGATLFVTVEPCTMCFGAMIHARLARLVFGCSEPKAGVVLSNIRLAEREFYNHKLSCQGGVMEDECAVLLQQFFRARRASTE